MGCCNEFTRSHAAASAGAGLPAIEPGMPTPAGTGLTRRSMLLGSAGLALTVYGAADRYGLAAFEDGIAEAASGPPGSVIVTIFMEGGIDGLSVLAPVNDAGYIAKRSTLRLDGAGTLPVTGSTDLRWHPKAAGLKALHDAGKATLFPAISYEHPNQSHFTSRHFYEVGALDETGSTGWLGRWLDIVGSVNNPIQGLTLGGQLSPMLASVTNPVAAAYSPSGYDFPSPGVYSTSVTTAMANGFTQLGGAATSDPTLAQARKAQANSALLNTQFATPLGTPPAYYPANNDLAGSLRDLALMLSATPTPLPIRACALRANGGFDTHSAQATTFGDQLESNCLAIQAFQQHLESAGIADRVITLLWSEFGRRPEENDSGGTDHGAAGVGFLIGTKANGQIVGAPPSLAPAGLDADGNVRATSDFRELYCSLLEGWMNTDAAQVIPGAAGLGRYAILDP